MSSNQRLRLTHSGSGSGADISASPESGILNEQILLLVLESTNWDLTTVCVIARVNRKLRAVSKRILWRELCLYRAPRMVSELAHGIPGTRIGGGWHTLAKLLFFCCGAHQTTTTTTTTSTTFPPVPGHFVTASRFSKTSGRSFLTSKCRGDLLYISDPCEHQRVIGEEDLGVYRGVFRGFIRSKTRAYLIGRQVDLEERVRCPYCGARVWSMTCARMVPRSAALRLGTRQGGLEYFVCINGHLHGTCWLLPLSSDEDDDEKEADDDDDDDDGDDRFLDENGGIMKNECIHSYYGTTSSNGDECCH